MSVTILTPSNTQRLTTLAAVMAEITMDDQLIFAESLIDQASAAVARECGTIFAQQAYREVQLGEYLTRYLFLRYGPMVAVSNVSAGATVMTDYRLAGGSPPMLYRGNGWYLPQWSEREWTVDYIAGYILPEQLNPPEPTGPTLRAQASDLERATLETIKVWFHERLMETRIQSRSLGDQRIDYGVQALRTGIPALAKDLLKPWKCMVLA
jgi:hypothetical protein